MEIQLDPALLDALAAIGIGVLPAGGAELHDGNLSLPAGDSGVTMVQERTSARVTVRSLDFSFIDGAVTGRVGGGGADNESELALLDVGAVVTDARSRCGGPSSQVELRLSAAGARVVQDAFSTASIAPGTTVGVATTPDPVVAGGTGGMPEGGVDAGGGAGGNHGVVLVTAGCAALVGAGGLGLRAWRRSRVGRENDLV